MAFWKKIVKNQNYKVISNSIDAKKFSFNLTTRENIRNQLKINGKYVIGHVGRMTEPKNHLFLIDVFYELCKLRNDVVLLLVGDGDLKNVIKDKLTDYSLQDKVLMIGNTANPSVFYQAMDIFVFPSLWEGFGNVAIEAQTSGLLCIVSERIPKEITIDLKLVKVLNLSDGAQVWAKTIDLLSGYKREDHVLQACLSGYDIEENTKFLQNFFLQFDANK